MAELAVVLLTGDARRLISISHSALSCELPLGILGDLAHVVIVRRDVEAIFDYRCERITKVFA